MSQQNEVKQDLNIQESIMIMKISYHKKYTISTSFLPTWKYTHKVTQFDFCSSEIMLHLLFLTVPRLDHFGNPIAARRVEDRSWHKLFYLKKYFEKFFDIFHNYEPN